MKKFFFISGFYIFFSACSPLDTFQNAVSIPSQKWLYTYTPEFNAAISDTSVKYNVFVILRHTDAYKYNNLWIRLGSKAPGDIMRYQNINLTLSNDINGWEGKGMDDIFEVRKNITPGPIPFNKAGTYTFSIAQIMRENPLQHILNVGIRIEKVKL